VLCCDFLVAICGVVAIQSLFLFVFVPGVYDGSRF
jgi:hypothetical protein